MNDARITAAQLSALIAAGSIKGASGGKLILRTRPESKALVYRVEPALRRPRLSPRTFALFGLLLLLLMVFRMT